MYQIGEYVVCVDITQKPYKYYKREDITTLTKGRKYEILNISEYSNTITLLNDKGIRLSYSPRRFQSINKFRNYKLDKIIKKIRYNEKISTFEIQILK